MDTWLPMSLQGGTSLPHADPWVPACLGSPPTHPPLLGVSEDSQLGLPLCVRGPSPPSLRF